MSGEDNYSRYREPLRHEYQRRDRAYAGKRIEDEIKITRNAADSVRDARHSRAAGESSERELKRHREFFTKSKARLLKEISSVLGSGHQWYGLLDAILVSDADAEGRLRALLALVSECESELSQEMRSASGPSSRKRRGEGGEPVLNLIELRLKSDAEVGLKQIEHIRVSVDLLLSRQRLYSTVMRSPE